MWGGLDDGMREQSAFKPFPLDPIPQPTQEHVSVVGPTPWVVCGSGREEDRDEACGWVGFLNVRWKGTGDVLA